MKKAKQLAKLVEITSAELQVANLGLVKLRQKEEILRSQLTILRNSRSFRANENLILTDSSLVVGADLKWLAWIEVRSSLLNQELLDCIVAQEKYLKIVRRAFGRAEVVKSLEVKNLMMLKNAKLKVCRQTS